MNKNSSKDILDKILNSIDDVVIYKRTNNLKGTVVHGIQFCPSTRLYLPSQQKYYEKSIPYNRYEWLRKVHKIYDMNIRLLQIIHHPNNIKVLSLSTLLLIFVNNKKSFLSFWNNLYRIKNQL